MMTIAEKRDLLIEALREEGLNVELISTDKNGITRTGIRYNNAENVQPVFYADELLENEPVNYPELVERIKTLFSQAKLEVNPEEITNPEFIRRNVKIRFQHQCNKPGVITRAGFYPDSVQLMRVVFPYDGGEASVIVTKELLNAAHISEEEVWECARKNTDAETVIQNMTEVMAHMGYGEAVSDLEFEQSSGSVMYVITNRSTACGASCILNTNAIKARVAELSADYDRVVCIPSSVHENIFVPLRRGDAYDEQQYREMISNVNGTQVPEEDLLSGEPMLIQL